VETQEKSDGSPEMDRFRSALKRVMQVSKEDLKRFWLRKRLPTLINQSVVLNRIISRVRLS
jgi:hypothetical protein